jgi:hypothetical protein
LLLRALALRACIALSLFEKREADDEQALELLKVERSRDDFELSSCVSGLFTASGEGVAHGSYYDILLNCRLLLSACLFAKTGPFTQRL